MRRLLPYLGFLPLLLLLAVRAFAQEDALPGWDPSPDASVGLAYLFLVPIGGPMIGLMIGLAGLGRGRLHRMRAVPRIYDL